VVTPLRPRVAEALRAHGLDPGDDEPAVLRDRLNDRYLEEVRRLRERQVQGEIPLRDYAGKVAELRERFSLLGLPLPLWSE
jgi:hypothetical protein